MAEGLPGPEEKENILRAKVVELNEGCRSQVIKDSQFSSRLPNKIYYLYIVHWGGTGRSLGFNFTLIGILCGICDFGL